MKPWARAIESVVRLNLEMGRDAHVDFNAVDADGRVRVSRARYSGAEPHEGMWITLRDSEGNRCEAAVAEVGALFLRAVPDLRTWVDGDMRRQVQVSAVSPVIAWDTDTRPVPDTTDVVFVPA